MQFYRYFKGHEKKGIWRPFPVEQDAENFAAPKYGFNTILAINEEVNKGGSVSNNALYSGPFYIDIDSDEVKKSIKAVLKATGRLINLGVKPNQMGIWASGKKGFHIIVPMPLFCEEESAHKLPMIYGDVARHLSLPEETDLSVYSLGRGRMWRIANKQRLDNQAFKVPLHFSQLATLTPEVYKDLCSAPRPEIAVINGARVSNLTGFYSHGYSHAQSYVKPKSTLIDANLKAALGEAKVPPCVRQLMMGENTRGTLGFNSRSVQMNKAIRAFVTTDEVEHYTEVFAQNSTGKSHGTYETRKEHVVRGRASVQGASDYGWSCRSMLSVLASAPCDDCPISWIRDEQADTDDGESLKDAAQALQDNATAAEAPERLVSEDEASTDTQESDPEAQPVTVKKEKVRKETPPENTAPKSLKGGADEGLTITDEGYGFMDFKGGIRRVSNFILRITKVYYEYIKVLEQDRRVSVHADVFISSKKVGSVAIEENSWQSKSTFVQAFAGLSNCGFYGKDDDVQRMKITLMHNVDKTATRIQRVHASGIHHRMIAGNDVLTYVEPNWSIDNFGNENLISLSGQVQAAPQLKSVPMLSEAGDAHTTELLRKLFKVSAPENVAQLTGWIMACFLKQHIMALNNEFPLFSPWGAAGSGKTQTSGLFAALHGVAYLGGNNADSPLSVGGDAATNFALWYYIASSMTVPRIVEEYNAANLGRKYNMYGEYFKEAWNQHAVKRGTIRNQKHHGPGAIDAGTVDIVMSGPLMLISEQSIQMPALVQRTVQMQLKPQHRAGADVREAYNYVRPRYRDFRPFARTAYMEALHITPKQALDWVHDGAGFIPYTIGDRPHYSFCVLLAGLTFLDFISDKYTLKLKADIADMRGNLIRYVQAHSFELSVDKQRSEVDLVLYEIAVMADATEKTDNQSQKTIIKGIHYLLEDEYLYVDGMVCHHSYVRYMSQSNKRPVIESYVQFKALITSEAYCESTEATLAHFNRGRKVFKLHVEKLRTKGIDVDRFAT